MSIFLTSIYFNIHFLTIYIQGVPVVVQRKQIRPGTMRLQVQSLALLSGLRIWPCHELWYRSKTQLRPCVAVAVAVAGTVAPIRLLAWETPSAASAALKRKKRERERNSVLTIK